MLLLNDVALTLANEAPLVPEEILSRRASNVRAETRREAGWCNYHFDDRRADRQSPGSEVPAPWSDIGFQANLRLPIADRAADAQQ